MNDIPTGWQCPVCKRVLAPTEKYCDCAKEQQLPYTPYIPFYPYPIYPIPNPCPNPYDPYEPWITWGDVSTNMLYVNTESTS